MLYDDLKKDNMLSIKNKDSAARGIYSIVINKCMLLSVEKKAKNETLTDEDVLNILSKTIKELDDEIESFKMANRKEQVQVLLKQQETLKKYLPQPLTEEEIKTIILHLPDHSLPTIMRHFKEKYAGKCDMKMVNQIAKSLQ